MNIETTKLKRLEEIVIRLRHDVEKPRATVRMFVDILDQVKDDPQELGFWKACLLQSFESIPGLLDSAEAEIRDLTNPTTMV